MFANTKALAIPEGDVVKVECNGSVIWKKPSEAKWSENLVPTSVDTDGSIFNGKGYKDESRLNSSGAVTGQAESTATGFIEAKKGDTFQITGVRFGISSYAGVYGYVSLYNASKAKVLSVSCDAYGSGNGFVIDPLIKDRKVLPTDVIEVRLTNVADTVAFIRFSASIQALPENSIAKQSGADMVVRKWLE